MKEGPPHDTWVRLFVRFMGNSNKKEQHCLFPLGFLGAEESRNDAQNATFLRFAILHLKLRASHCISKECRQMPTCRITHAGQCFATLSV